MTTELLLPQEEPLAIAIAGGDKSGKTTLALSFPAPIVVFEFDINTVARAIWRFKPPFCDPAKEIFLIQYPEPPTFGKEKDRKVGQLWAQFGVDLVAVLTMPHIKTIIIETATRLWKICHTVYLQELNEKKARESLLSIEYGPPNARMAGVIFKVRSANKHLVLTHHLRPVYAKIYDTGKQTYIDIPTGDLELDGFSKTEALIDTSMWVGVDGKKPYGLVRMCGHTSMEIMGLRIEEPTYDKLRTAINAYRMVG